jgi:hypothetical protein
LARVLAKRVLPEPVGPIRRDIAFLDVHPAHVGVGEEAPVVLYTATDRTFFARS